MQILLVTGPGGAGSSTVAAATALQVAASGARCVLLTARGPAVAGLDAAVRVEVVEPQRALEDVWGRHADALAAALPVLTVPPASSVVAVPGVPELALLAALAGHAASGESDVVVLDAGPLPVAVALLALPGTLRWWLAQAVPQRLRVLATLRAAVVPGRPGGVATALAGVAGLEALLDRVHLADPDRTAVHLVLRPEPSAVEDLRAAGTGLAVLGQRVASVTVGRLLPAGAGEWAARRAAVQRAAVAGVRGLLDGTGTVREVVEAAVPPADVAGLRALDAAVPAASTAASGPAAAAPVPHRDGGGWLLALPLPFARRGEVELTRWGDDLVVTAAGRRRSLPLDPLLRRCTVAGGRLVGPGTAAATLDIRFTPDPAQWPAGLLDTEESTA
ncbi:ArsA family ATPase [Modestobacter lapidis]|nr:ion transporter [Modestobacter lapidis]